MKKTLSVLLSVLLLSLVTVPSFAAPATLNKENPVGSVKIFTGEGKQDEYELTIPADTEIPWEATSYAIGKLRQLKCGCLPARPLRWLFRRSTAQSLSTLWTAQRLSPTRLQAQSKWRFTGRLYEVL